MIGMIRRAKVTVGRKSMPSSASASSGSRHHLFRIARTGVEPRPQKQIELRHLGEVALGIVKEEHAAAQKGGVSDADAQKRAMARVAALRYGNSDYYWINDMHPNMVMHPIKPEMNGNDLSAYKDPNGKLLFVDFADTVRKTARASFPTSGPSRASTSLSRNCPMWSALRRGTGSSAPASTSTTLRRRPGLRPSDP